MRIIETIAHPTINISFYSMNDKYLVKFEAGPMEQCFKIQHQQVKGIAELKEKITPEFIEKVRLRFNEMYMQYKEI